MSETRETMSEMKTETGVLDFKPIRVNGGLCGGEVIHPSARSIGKIQVTRFTDDGVVAGHEEYSNLTEALMDRWQMVEHPVSRLAYGNEIKIFDAWEFATFNHPDKDKLVNTRYVYVSLLRPLWGVMVDGTKSTDRTETIGVLYRDEVLPVEKLISLSLVPVSVQAIREFIEEAFVAPHKTGEKTE